METISDKVTKSFKGQVINNASNAYLMFKNVLENNSSDQVPGVLSDAIDVISGGIAVIGGRRLV